MKLFQFVYVFLFLTTVSLFSDQFERGKYIQKQLEKTAQSFHISNKPSWVRDIDYEEEDIEENIDSSGLAFLLYHHQYNVEKEVHYVRSVRKIVSQDIPIRACTFPVELDFKDQNLIMYHINIIRNGEVIEKLPTVKMKHFYPPSGGSSNREQIVFYIDNLDIGDVIDIALSITNKNDFCKFSFPGYRFCLCDFPPYKKAVYNCLIDKDRSLSWKTSLFELDPIYSFRDDYKVYTWETNDLHKAEFLPTVDEPNQKPSIEISASNWNDIANYFATVFKAKSNFSPDPPQKIIQLVEEWRDVYPTKEEQILAAIRFVTDNIYYLCFPDEEKEHYFTPYFPDEIVEKHYGDCKDKSCLLVALLQLLDVESYPVMVNTDQTYKNALPMAYFNHIIVNIKYNGKSYFIDPTTALRGGTLDTYQISNLGYGLILKEDSEELVPITRNFLSKYEPTATISIQDGNLAWDQTTQYYHCEADILRGQLFLEYLTKKKNSILSSIKNELFPNTASVVYTSPLQVEDDRKTNVITKKFSVSVESVGMKTKTGVVYDLSSIMKGIPFEGNKQSSKTFSLEKYGLRTEMYRTIDIHCDKIPCIEEKRVSYADDNLSYNLSIEKISDTDIRVILHQEILKDYIEAKELPHFYKKLEEFKNHLNLKIEIPD